MRCARALVVIALLLHVIGTGVRAEDDDGSDGAGVPGRAKRLRQIDDQVQREASPNWEEPDPLDEEHDDFDDPDERDDADDDGEPEDPYDDGEHEEEAPQPVDLDEAPVRRPKGPLDRSPIGTALGPGSAAADDDD
ncbi:MAG: hypothetical protein KIT14_11040 [bacterium]|nr:hypothetical protein [bacterium]